MNLLSFLCFLLVLCVYSTKTRGVYSVYYLSTKGCVGDLIVASLLTDQCVDVEETGISFQYSCESGVGRNVTFDIFRQFGCQGPLLTSVPYGETGKCAKNLYSTHTSQEYYCLEDFKVKYDYLEFGIPYFLNHSDVGTFSNPIIGNAYIPLSSKCIDVPDSKYHMKTTCDGNEGMVKVYESGLCMVAIKKLKLKIGGVYDYGQFMNEKVKEKKLLQYKGCGKPKT